MMNCLNYVDHICTRFFAYMEEREKFRSQLSGQTYDFKYYKYNRVGIVN